MTTFRQPGKPWVHGVTHEGVDMVLDEHGQFWDRWEYEHRELIERVARKMAIACAQDPDMQVCLGHPDRVPLPGTYGYRAGSEHPTRVKPLWRYYERLAIVAIRELKDGEANLESAGLPGQGGPDTMAG